MVIAVMFVTSVMMFLIMKKLLQATTDMASGHFSRHPPLISYAGRENCHESNFYLSNALLSSIQLPFEQGIYLIKC